MTDQLTPAQQNLLNFLDKLATSPYSPELMQEGHEALDQAVEEHRRCSESIHETQSALAQLGFNEENNWGIGEN